MMAITQEALINESLQKLLLRTDIPLSDLHSQFNDKEFYRSVYYELSVLVANRIFEKIGPAIDKAIKEWQEDSQ